MTDKELPEWLIEYLEENTGYKHKGMWVHNKQRPTVTDQSDAVVEFYDFISKPENAAKIPEVAELIKEAQSMVDKVENEYSTSWLEDALAPFKKEGSNV